MAPKKKDKLLLWLALGGFCMVGVSVVLMIPHPKLSSEAMSLTAGILFWLSVVTGVVCQTMLSSRRRKWERKNRNKSGWKKIGTICFLRNKPAKVADTVMLVSAVAFIVSLLLTNAAGYACYAFLGLLIASFAAHSIFNGKNYTYVFSK